MKTIEQVKREFDRSGTTIADWAKQNGYSYQCVQRILNGQSRCKRGQAHEIAVKLKIKEGYLMTEK